MIAISRPFQKSKLLAFCLAVIFTCSFSCSEVEEIAAFQENLSITIAAGEIYGTLEVPNTEGPVPLVLIISGAGPTNRDGNSASTPGKNNALSMISEELLLQNIASFRYDKRGVGESVDAIDENGLLFNDYITDAISWVKELRKDNRFSSIGILGHSEGSLIGMVAASSSEVDFFVSVAGAGRPADQLIIEQFQGAEQEVLDYAIAVLAELKKGNMVTSIPPPLRFIFGEPAQPFLINWIQYDPQREIAKLDIPVSIIHGAHDITVPLSEAQFLADAKPDAQFRIIEGMNHVFKDAPANPQQNLITYTDPSIPLSDNFVSQLVTYLEKTL